MTEPAFHLPMPGDNLDNGALLIAIKQKERRYYVLGLQYKAAEPEYVTWAFDPECDGATFWGHYFKDFNLAAKDFAERGE